MGMWVFMALSETSYSCLEWIRNKEQSIDYLTLPLANYRGLVLELIACVS